MAISLTQIELARRQARFHLQGEITALPADPQTPSRLAVRIRITAIFRGTTELAIGDTTTLEIPLHRQGELVSPGEEYLPLEHMEKGRFVEAFADGEVPKLRSIASSVEFIDHPTVQATMGVDTLSSGTDKIRPASMKRPWWKFL